MSPEPLVVTQPVEEIERRLKWRVLSMLTFIALVLMLLAIAVVSLTLPPRHPLGLAPDPGSDVALRALAGRVHAQTNALRWSATVLGGEAGGHAPGPDAPMLVAAARPTLEAVRRHHRRDPRALAALAALDVVTHAYPHAAERYLAACDLAPHYGEARLGAGVALALEADRTAATWRARALRLQAIAQFAMVDSVDAEYPLALYDRALTLRDAGRAAEGAFWAARYLALARGDEHAAALREAFGLQ